MNNEDKKIVLKVYVKEGKYFIERDMASSFGLISGKPLDNTVDNYIPITNYMHDALINNKAIRVKHVNVIEKEEINVYIDGLHHCIKSSDAYSLGLLSEEEYNNSNSLYYYISDEMLRKLREEYQVKLVLLNTYKKSLVKSI